MTGEVTIRPVDLPGDMSALTRLCWDYRDHLAGLGGDVLRIIEAFYPRDEYQTLIDALPAKHARPRGAILLAIKDGTPVGCGMIQPLNEADAEIKRVFIDKDAQGTGAGEMLSRALIAQAQSDGYQRILLDTTSVSAPARRLYEKLGFQLRGPYSDIPPKFWDIFVFYELKL